MQLFFKSILFTCFVIDFLIVLLSSVAGVDSEPWKLRLVVEGVGLGIIYTLERTTKE